MNNYATPITPKDIDDCEIIVSDIIGSTNSETTVGLRRTHRAVMINLKHEHTTDKEYGFGTVDVFLTQEQCETLAKQLITYCRDNTKLELAKVLVQLL